MAYWPVTSVQALAGLGMMATGGAGLLWTLIHLVRVRSAAPVVSLALAPVVAPEPRGVPGPAFPDMSVRAALHHLYIDSAWASGRAVDDGVLLTRAAEEFRDAARVGRIHLWGRPRPKYRSAVFKTPLEPMPPEYWAEAMFDLTTCFLNSRADPASRSAKDSVVVYGDLQASRGEVLACWPPAAIPADVDPHRLARAAGPNERLPAARN